jgi:hypothetical protein
MALFFRSVFLIAALLPLVWEANAMDASKMLASCEVLLREMPVPGEDIALPKDGLPCWYYMSAIQDSGLLSNITRKPFLSTCVPPNSTVAQLIRIFVSYAQSHPAGLSSPAVDLVFEALREAYPQSQCKPWAPFYPAAQHVQV